MVIICSVHCLVNFILFYTFRIFDVNEKNWDGYGKNFDMKNKLKNAKEKDTFAKLYSCLRSQTVNIMNFNKWKGNCFLYKNGLKFG